MARRNRSLSPVALRVLGLMLEDPAADHYGLDLSRRAGVLTGTIYPLLRRLEERGWLESSTEPIDAALEGRPARRLYRLTGAGEHGARAELAGRQGFSLRRGVSPA